MVAASHPPDTPSPPAVAAVLGIPLATAGYDEVLDWIDAMVASRSPGYLIAAAVHLVMLAQEDASIREAVLGASLVVPDGQPLVWALRLLGHREISARVYGPDLMLACCERAAACSPRRCRSGRQRR